MDDRQERETLFEKHRENIYFRWGLTAFVVIALGVLVAQFVTKLPALVEALKLMLKGLSPALYGLGIAYLLDPIVGRVELVLRPRLEKCIKTPSKAQKAARGLGVLASLVLLIALAWALLAMVLPQLLDSINTLIGSLPAYYNTLSSWVTGLISDNLEMADFTNKVMDTVFNYMTNWISSTLLPKVEAMVATLTSSVVSMARALLNLVIGLIISIYLLMGKRRFLAQSKKFCYAILGEKRGGYFCNICTFANHAFGGFIGGKIIDSAIIGVLCFIGLSIMKMPYTLLISIIVGVTNIIPFFGPYLGAVPSALLLLVIDPMQCVYFLIFIVILQQIDGNVIGPMILGDATGLDGFWVVVSILVFGSFYGIPGMVIGVPTFAVIYKLVTELVNRLLRDKGLSTVTEDYTAFNYPPRPHVERWRNQSPRKQRRHLRRMARQEKRTANAPESTEADKNEPKP